MNLTADYEKLLEDNLRDELEWLQEELSLQFKQKQLKHSYSKDDISLGNQILDNVIENIKSNNNEQVLTLLAITLNSLEKQFPEFF